MSSRIRIYDIDGTITKPGHDLWHLTTRNLVGDAEAFDNEVGRWKESMKRGGCPYIESKKMMTIGLELIQSDVGGAEIEEEARKRTAEIVHHCSIFPGAIEHIKASIDNGFQVVFSTTNYHAGGIGFVTALKEEGLLDGSETDSIAVSGSRVNWKSRDVIYFNMDKGKVTGVCDTLGYTYDELRGIVDSSYGDDSTRNDREILGIAQRAYVIQNEKNKDATVEPNMQIVDWDFINEQEVQDLIPNKPLHSDAALRRRLVATLGFGKRRNGAKSNFTRMERDRTARANGGYVRRDSWLPVSVGASTPRGPGRSQTASAAAPCIREPRVPNPIRFR